MRVRLFRDQQGFPRAEAQTPCEALGWFLEQDVQSDTGSGREIIGLIDEVRSGNLVRWEGTGNAHTLVLTPELASIVNNYSDPPAGCELPIEDLKTALIDWIAFIEGSS
jgi:hypothetical protein